jgi:hypothetical protein
MFLFDKALNSLFSPSQSWLKKAERISCPAPLPEGPRAALLTAMLAEAPYEAPEKKEKKKGEEGDQRGSPVPRTPGL